MSVSRGRPLVYTGAIRENIISVIRSTDNGNGANIRLATAILNSRKIIRMTRALQAKIIIRKHYGIGRALKISYPTVLKIAHEANIRVRNRTSFKFGHGVIWLGKILFYIIPILPKMIK